MPQSPPPVRYDGSACLNVRSIIAACRTLSERSDKPLPWSELSSVLWFVEICVMSKGVFFDGTVPRETADRAIEEIERFKGRHDLARLKVEKISFEKPRDTLRAAKDAMGESGILLQNFKLDPTVDEPVEQNEHNTFVEELGVARSLHESEREALALSWVSDAFRGSKCLAGIVVNGDEMLNAAHALYQSYALQGPLVTGALINRFRLNYVNQLASHKLSAYRPNPEFEVLTKQHYDLFSDYLVKTLLADIKKTAGQGNILVENMTASTSLPPLGLYALAATNAAGHPGAILETAYNEFREDDALMQLIWSHSKGGIALKKSKSDETYSQEIDDYFYGKYRKLEQQAEGIKMIKSRAGKARSYLIPAILKGLVKAVPNAVTGGAWAIVYDVLKEAGTEASIPFLSDRLMVAGCDSYISQYQILKWNLEKHRAVQQPLAKIADHVQHVFGRPLVWN